jgi:hypothetical protein
MENPEIEQNRDRIQKVLTNLGIEHSMSAVDEWRKVLFHRGECRNIEEYIALLREVVQRGDEEKTPVERPNQAGKIIGKILLERKEKLQTEQQPPRTTSRNLSQEIEDAQERDPERVRRFQLWWDALIKLEKENESFDDPHHSRMRHFIGDDIRRGRIRDNSERYVQTRIAALQRYQDQKTKSQALAMSA